MISKIFEVGATLIDSILCIWFITFFNKDSKKKVYLWLPAFALIFGSQLIFDKYLPDFSILGTSIQFIISAVYALIIANRHYIKAIISACIYKVVLIALGSSLFSLYSAIFSDFTSLMDKTGAIPRFIYVISHKVLFFAILYLILKIFRRDTSWKKPEAFITFGFSIITVAGMALLLSISKTIHGTAPLQIEMMFRH